MTTISESSMKAMKSAPPSQKKTFPKPRRPFSQTKKVKGMKNVSFATAKMKKSKDSSSDTQVPSISELCKY